MPSLPFPEHSPNDYRRFLDTLEPDHPLHKVGRTHPQEARPDPESLADPTGDRRLRPAPLLVRKHSNRVVLLVARRCFQHCRFCFRRGEERNEINVPDDLTEALAWIGRQPAVQEVILSGGDPLTLPDLVLADLGRRVAAVPHVQRWRVHTRAPVVAPERVTRGLVEALREGPHPRVIFHATHPAELRPEVKRAARRFLGAGIDVLNQSVLLAGVNDDPTTLGALYGGLARWGVPGHYLHHPDRAPGNRAFRVPIARGVAIYRGLRERMGELAPPYVLDLPCGAGKTPVDTLRPVAEECRGAARRTRYRWTRPPGWDTVAGPARDEWWDIWHPSPRP